MMYNRWTGLIRRAPIPKTRDPFVNTPLIRVPGADGAERFWISSWNGNAGTTAVLIDARGEHRIYRFGREHGGFYSAVAIDPQTLWLCGDLARVVRLDLSTGKFDVFETGAPAALVFQGMACDKATGKLFAAAFPPPETSAFSFDTRTGRTTKVWTAFTEAHYMRFSFPNVDGTHGIVMHLPGIRLLRWDPRTDALEEESVAETLDIHASEGPWTHSLVADDAGRRYFPGRGWYDGLTRCLRDGPRPQREMTWFARQGQRILGASSSRRTAEIAAWDVRSGEVETLCEVPDAGTFNVNATADGRIVAVNMYGEFFRFDGATGALECSKRLPTDAVGRVDCICRIDADRVLGTPFITQRFWELDLRTGEGVDCGRAAPGGGEILRTWRLGSKAYMAAYTGGELTEYDPSLPARFPENPIRSLWLDAPRRRLLAGTSLHADCQSCPPRAERCVLALIDADRMEVLEQVPAPTDTDDARVVGPLDAHRCVVWFQWRRPGRGVVDMDALRTPAEDELREWPAGFREIAYAGTPGRFVLRIGDALELWDLRTDERLTVLMESEEIDRFFVQDDSVLIVTSGELVVLEGCLNLVE
jgi:hypothetical protein